MEWQGKKLWEKYNRYGKVGLETYGNGDWKLETNQWQNGRVRRIEIRDILLRENYRWTMTNELALVRREIMEWYRIENVVIKVTYPVIEKI